MRRSIVTITVLVAIIAGSLPAQALTPVHFWSQRVGGTTNDYGSGVAVDAAGNVYFTGSFTGTADFGGGSLVSAGADDIYLAKYNAAGVHQWTQRFGSSGIETGTSVAVDGFGNVFVTGYFQGTVDFGGGPLVSAGGQDVFVAKYSGVGAHLWSRRFGAGNSDIGYCVAVDGTGNVLVIGVFVGMVDFGGGVLIGPGIYDVFLARYDATGAHQWSKGVGGADSDYGYAVDVDNAGNAFVAGYFAGTANFGGGNLVSAGGQDVFLAKYDPSGTHAWSKRFGSATTDIAHALAVDGSGNVTITGQFNGTTDFGGGNLATAGGNDVFLARYDPSGTHVWSKRLGGTSSDIGYSVDIDASDNVLLTGSFQGSSNLGGGTLVSAGGNDIFMARYNASGAHQWSHRIGGTGTDSGPTLAVDGSQNVLISGYFQGTVDFGGGALVSAGGYDGFFAKYSGEPQEPGITSISDIGNDQGRKVNIRFTRSWYDQASSPMPVVQYEAYRRYDAPPALAAIHRDPAGLSADELLVEGWTFAGSVPAHAESVYRIDVPTIGDSTIALGQYHSVFYVRAATTSPATFYDSPVDSGYSLDNLAPAVPQNFAFNAGALTWTKSSAEDFDYFTVYGSNTDSFGSATVVDYSVAPSLDVNASPYVFYFVTATDFSGNEGKPARVNTLSGVGGTPKNYVLSVSNYPNPFNPGTTVRYTAPSPGEVKVRIYDARGALVKTLFDGYRAEGAYTVTWDGRTDDAAVAASGVYFARIEHASGTKSKKMVLLK